MSTSRPVGWILPTKYEHFLTIKFFRHDNVLSYSIVTCCTFVWRFLAIIWNNYVHMQHGDWEKKMHLNLCRLTSFDVYTFEYTHLTVQSVFQYFWPSIFIKNSHLVSATIVCLRWRNYNCKLHLKFAWRCPWSIKIHFSKLFLRSVIFLIFCK